MSVSTWKRSPSFTRPIATPATAPLIGTPASISARLVPHTLAIELEPFDSRISETTRMTYGNVAMSGMHGGDAAAGEVAVADLAALRRAHHAGLADAERREVVVEHERLFALAAERIDDLRVAAGAERRHDQRLRLAAREQRRAVRARQHAGADRDRTHRLHVAAVDARLAGEHAPPNDAVFEIGEFLADVVGVELRRFAAGQRQQRPLP